MLLISPVFKPGSKTVEVSLLDRSVYAEILEKALLPCFALGGISSENLKDCWHLKLSGFAVISAIFSAADPAKATKELIAAWDSIAKGQPERHSV